MANKWSSFLLDVLFPPHCAYCNTVLAGGTVCETCGDALPRILPPVCPHCGFPKEDCGCRGRKHMYDAVAAPFLYEGKAAASLKRFKFGDRPQIAGALAEELAACFRQYYEEESVDMVCAVPMHAKKQRQRGYNQSVLLADKTAALLRLPFDKNLLKKPVETDTQHDLPSHLREGNVLGAYELSKQTNVMGATVLLIDDIKTTGATLHECAKVLKVAGAQRILALCVAITAAEKRENG